VLRLADKLALLLACAGVGVLGLATLVLMADIALRRTIGVSITGTVDLTQLAQMYCVALALPLVFLREGNVAVDFLTGRLPARVRAVLQAVAHLACAGLLGAMAWHAWVQAAIQAAQGDRSQTLGIPMQLYWLPLLAGLMLASLGALLLAVREVRASGGSPGRSPA
jgi:TRAP-type C4-dicarboxylate transport system permease small subunit